MKKIIGILIVLFFLANTISAFTITRKEVTQYNDYQCLLLNGKYKVMTDLPYLSEKILKDMNDKKNLNTLELDDLPDSFSWTNFGGDWTTPAKDQQNCGCTSFSALAAMEAAINIAKGDPNFDRDLSEQYVLSCLPEAGSCSGGWPSEAIALIKDTGPSGNYINGCPLESCMSYQAEDYISCDEKCDDWDYYTVPPAEDNVLFQILDYGVTSITPSSPSDWELLKTWIITYGPICVDIYGSNGWASFWDSHHSPTAVYEGTETGITTHTQLLCGWVNDNNVVNGGYWILKNSWGTSWGYNGFHNLAYGCLMLGDRDVVWVTTPLWPEEEGNPACPWNPPYFVFAGWNYNPTCPKSGTELQFIDLSKGPVVLWNWDFNGDGVWDVSGSGFHEKNPKWTYNLEGIFQVKQEVWASSGLYSNLTKNVVVKEIWPPTAISKPSYYGGKDNDVYFEGRFSYDVDGQITGYAWDFNGDETIDTTQPYHTYTYPNQNGEYNATLKITDNDGAIDTSIILVRIDKTVPPITETITGGLGQDEELWFKGKVVVELRTTDWSGVSRLFLKIDNGDWLKKYGLGELEYSYIFKIQKHGIHTIQFYAIDKYGNIESTKTINVGIDNNIPSMDFVLDGVKNEEGFYITPVKIIINANDADSGVETIVYKINTGGWEDYTSPFTINQGGSHTGYIIVEDKAGNIVEGTFTIQLEYKPSAPLISGLSSGKPNVEYTYSFTSADTEGDQVSYYVDWGDDTNNGWSSYVNSGTTVQLKHTWTEEKVYTLKAKAKDNNNAESDWSTFVISMPKTHRYNPIIQLLFRMLERFPFFEKILNQYYN